MGEGRGIQGLAGIVPGMHALPRSLVLGLLLTVTGFSWAQSTPARVNLTGFWKPDCQLPFGVQIVPSQRPVAPSPVASAASSASAAAGAAPATTLPLYALNFCGPGGCATQQEYRPDSPIIGDPAFQIEHGRLLRVMGREGWSALHKCSDNPDPGPQTRLR